MEKICKQCDTVFQGRKNQKYCTTKCKAAFNNERAKERDYYLNRAIRDLKENKKTLGDVYKLFGSEVISATLISKLKLNFGATSTKTPNGNCCYGEYELRRVDLNHYRIIKHK